MNTNIKSSGIPDKSLFVKASDSEKAMIDVMRPTTTYWQDAWRSLKSNKLALTALVFIIIVALLAIFGPIFSKYSYEATTADGNLKPSLQHLFGTDSLGRDMFVRNMIGTRISLSIGILSAIIVVFIGILYGAISGFFGGWVDNIMMRVIDLIYAVPTILLAIILQVALYKPMQTFFEGIEGLKDISGTAPGLVSIVLVLVLLFWVDMARIVRGQVLQLKQQEYVLAAKALGASNRRIITKHLIPNCIGPIIVTAAFKIPQAIFYEAFLSFIGLGVSPPMVSLGSLTQSGLNGIYSYTYLLIPPTLLISVVILSFNLLGDGLRDALDPRIKK